LNGEKGKKQPWHIHRRDGEPLYLAALANFAPDTEVKTSKGLRSSPPTRGAAWSTFMTGAPSC
jgi:putative SOS response-associated peptidase YedK